MKIKQIFYSSRFIKSFKRLPKSIQRRAFEKEKIFKINCFDSQLKTHKLHGEFANYWGFSVNYSDRIIFQFRSDGSIGFIAIGDHSIYE